MTTCIYMTTRDGERILLNGAIIAITSGEGEGGTSEVYDGKFTPRAIKARLTRERCHGARWARAVKYLHTREHGLRVGIDLETGEFRSFPALEGIELT